MVKWKYGQMPERSRASWSSI